MTTFAVNFLFEFASKMPSIAYMYASGAALMLLVFAATYFHRQFGLIALLIVGLICFQDIDAPSAEQSYINHWNYSCRITFAVSVILFFAAIILKRKIKQKNKLH